MRGAPRNGSGKGFAPRITARLPLRSGAPGRLRPENFGDDEFCGEGLSRSAAAAVDRAVAEVKRLARASQGGELMAKAIEPWRGKGSAVSGGKMGGITLGALVLGL